GASTAPPTSQRTHLHLAQREAWGGKAGRACRDLGRLASLANHMVAQALCSLGQREPPPSSKVSSRRRLQGALLDLSSSILQGPSRRTFLQTEDTASRGDPERGDPERGDPERGHPERGSPKEGRPAYSTAPPWSNPLAVQGRRLRGCCLPLSRSSLEWQLRASDGLEDRRVDRATNEPTDHLHLAQRRGLEVELERAGRACRDLGRLASLANHMVAQALCSLGQREATSFLKGVVQLIFCPRGSLALDPPLHLFQEAVQGALLDLSSSILQGPSRRTFPSNGGHSIQGRPREGRPREGRPREGTPRAGSPKEGRPAYSTAPPWSNPLAVQGRRLRGCCLPLSRSSLEWQLRASDVSEDRRVDRATNEPTDHLHLAQRRGLEVELERAGRACRDLGRLASLANHMVAQALCSLGQREATSFLKGVVQLIFCPRGSLALDPPLHLFQEAVQGALLDLSSSILQGPSRRTFPSNGGHSIQGRPREGRPREGRPREGTPRAGSPKEGRPAYSTAPPWSNPLAVQGRRLRGCCLPLSRSSLEWQLRASDVSEDVQCVGVYGDSPAACEVRMRKVFQEAEGLHPCVLLLRNLQYLGPPREGADEDSRVQAALYQLLTSCCTRSV
ncbi:hypothetical protein CRUP_018499, partial [Coryphaenoides rupestris]